MLKKPTKKSLAAISKKLSSDWKLNETGTQLSLVIRFTSYLKAFMFVTRVSINAEVLQTYPEITLTKSSVKLIISSPQLLANSDIELAEKIDFLRLSTKSS